MMLASSAIAASPPSADYVRVFGGMSLLSRTFLHTAPASLCAEGVTGLAKPRQMPSESRSDVVAVVADDRQEVVT